MSFEPWPWDEDALSLGRPRAMDTPTLIEWIQRQLETEEETEARHQEIREGFPSVLQLIQLQATSMYDVRSLRERWEAAKESDSGVVYLDKGMSITPINPDFDIIGPEHKR